MNDNPTYRLWLLRPRKDLPDDVGQNPWKPWYDKAFGFVIAAPTEQRAREMADQEAGGENVIWSKDYTTRTKRHPWLDPALSICVELTASEEGIIMMDFASA